MNGDETNPYDMHSDEAWNARNEPVRDVESGDSDGFWGATPDWTGTTSRPRRTRSTGRRDVTGAIKGLWNSALSAGVEGTREHGVFDATAPRPADDGSALDHAMFDDLDLEIPLSSSGRVDVVDAGDAPRRIARHDAFEPAAFEVASVDATTEVARVDATRAIGVDDVHDWDTDDWDDVEHGGADWGDDERLAVVAPESAAARGRLGARRAIDPLLVRIGAVAVVTTLLVPLAIGLTSGSDANDDTVASPPSDSVAAVIAPVATEVATTAAETTSVPLDPESLPAAVPVNTPAAVTDATDAADGSSTGSASGTSATADESGSDLAVASDAVTRSSDDGSSSDGVNDAATADAAAIRTCAIDYEVQPGDYWLRLADGAGVTLDDLLDVNDATSDTALYPGTDICLPAGSSTPAAPSRSTPTPTTTPEPAPSATTGAPTTPPSTTPSTTNPPTTTPSTTAPRASTPPTTVRPPTTTPAPAPSSASPAQIEQIIRDVWPDDLEDHALEIAYRESNYVPTAKNYCCYGLFQIYWSVHQSWLSGLGITSDQQLYDPATNARAAYALYQRSGGWGPWDL